MAKFDVQIWGTVGQWISITATFIVAVIALFKDEIIKWFRHPNLRISIKPGPPDCHKTTIYFAYENKPKTAGRYYLRLWVTNEGSIRAEKVQVFAAKLEKRLLNNTFEEVKNFLPMNLRWSQTGDRDTTEVFADGISSKMGKHCDLGHITSVFWQSALGESLPDVEQGKVIFILSVEVQTNTRSHFLAPGTYRLLLRLAASNSEPIERTVEIGFNGDWNDDENSMLTQNLYAKLLL
jgi:hypothetical protein